MPNKTLHLHLISDASGETVDMVASAVISQFEGIHVVKHFWPLVRSFDNIDEAIKVVARSGGIVIQTMLNDEMLLYLRNQCSKMNVPCFSPIEELTNIISSILGIEPTSNARSKNPVLDKRYFDKVNSINFAINHDDGNRSHLSDEADIIIYGVSRVSKTPISLYIAAHYGYRVANIPITSLSSAPYISSENTSSLKIGLTISPSVLSKVRSDRCDNISNKRSQVAQAMSEEYSSIEASTQELKASLALFRKHQIYVIDVTHKAIEEIAADIIKHLHEQQDKENVVDIVL